MTLDFDAEFIEKCLKVVLMKPFHILRVPASEIFLKIKRCISLWNWIVSVEILFISLRSFHWFFFGKKGQFVYSCKIHNRFNLGVKIRKKSKFHKFNKLIWFWTPSQCTKGCFEWLSFFPFIVPKIMLYYFVVTTVVFWFKDHMKLHLCTVSKLRCEEKPKKSIRWTIALHSTLSLAHSLRKRALQCDDKSWDSVQRWYWIRVWDEAPNTIRWHYSVKKKKNTHMPHDSARMLQKVSVSFVHSWEEKQKGHQSERYADT